MVEKVLGKIGAPIKSWAMVYKAVFQAVLLYGSKIWMVTDAMMTVLEGFHHIIVRWIAGLREIMGDGWEWEWSSLDTALETTGIWPIR